MTGSITPCAAPVTWRARVRADRCRSMLRRCVCWFPKVAEEISVDQLAVTVRFLL